MTTKGLEGALRQRRAVVAIVGLGYAGLPMAVEIARARFPVVGFDVDQRKADLLNAGRSPVSSITDREIQELHAAGTLSATTDPAALAAADVAIICVPTPLTEAREPDMRFVLTAGRAIAEQLHRGMLVILQSTCAPGTTRKLLLPELERRSGLRAGQEFYLAFAPERIDPGNPVYTVKNTPKLVGGIDAESTRFACLLYETFIEQVVPVRSPDVAEMAKLVENTFRFINISFVNEMALLCDRIGVNVWEVIEAAKSKPFAFMAHQPSAGVGGDCIPVVPLYLEATAREHGLDTELIRASAHVNEAMPRLIVDKVEQALRARGRPAGLLGAGVLVVGVTYKPDIADVRESAAVRVLEALLARGATATYHDPYIPTLTLAGQTAESVALTAPVVAAADAVLLLTPHAPSAVNYDVVMREAALVVDTHSGLRPRAGANVVNVWVPAALDTVRAGRPSNGRAERRAARATVALGGGSADGPGEAGR